MNIEDLTNPTTALFGRQRFAPTLSLAEPPDWTMRAACASIGGDFWFPEKGRGGYDAKEICSACVSRPDCLAYGLKEPYGIFGGMSEHERSKLARAGWQAGDPLPDVKTRNKVGHGAHDKGECPTCGRGFESVKQHMIAAHPELAA